MGLIVLLVDLGLEGWGRQAKLESSDLKVLIFLMEVMPFFYFLKAEGLLLMISFIFLHIVLLVFFSEFLLIATVDLKATLRGYL